jgi:hypothetical protein
MGLKHKELRNHRDLERRRKQIVFERENEILLNKASESDPNAIEAYNNKMREVDKEIKSSQINLESFDKVIKDVTEPFEKRSHRYRRLKKAENAVVVAMSSLILASILIMIFVPIIDGYVLASKILFAIGVGLLVVRIYLHHIETD